jgi:hypothetical protein
MERDVGILDRLKKSHESDADRDVAELRSLKARVAALPTRFPTTTKVVGSFAQHPSELVPLICRNIDDAATALTTGRDPKGNPITESAVGKGLGNLVQATREAKFVGGVSMALNMEGVAELMKAMDELAEIAQRLKARS